MTTDRDALVKRLQELRQRMPVSLSTPDMLTIDDAIAALSTPPAGHKVVCHADGERCHGCDHYKGLAAVCKYATPPAGEQEVAVALPFAILAEEMAALQRFHETAADENTYDVPKAMMTKLAGLGLVRHVVRGIYEETTFGLSVLNGDFAAPPDTRRLALEEAAKVADKHLARIKGHNPDAPMADLVAQGYGNAALNIAVELRNLAARSELELVHEVCLNVAECPPVAESDTATVRYVKDMAHLINKLSTPPERGAKSRQAEFAPLAWSCCNEVAALGKCVKWCGNEKKCVAISGED